MKKTEICGMLGIEYPIVQAPMGPYITTNLAAAVSNAGGFGTISHSGTGKIMEKEAPGVLKEMAEIHPKELIAVDGPMSRTPIEEIRKIVEMTNKPFGVNVRVAQEQPDAPYLIDRIIEEKESNPKVKEQLTTVITSAGNPELYTERLKDAGFQVVHVVPSVYHAKKSRDAGVDAVVASGHEAGGHIAWEPVHSSVLIPAVVDAVGDEIPVLAAGGFCDGKGLVSALAMGAQAIYMGTRFIATEESDFSLGYRNAVLEASERDTLVAAGVFGPLRWLRNEYAEELEGLVRKVNYNFQHPKVREFEREAGWAKSYVEGKTDDTPVGSGEVQGRIKKIVKVEELISGIVKEAEEIIREMPKKHLTE